MRASQPLFGFTSMSDEIKRSAVTERLGPRAQKEANSRIQKPCGKTTAEEEKKLISLQMSNKFHRRVGV